MSKSSSKIYKNLRTLSKDLRNEFPEFGLWPEHYSVSAELVDVNLPESSMR